METVDCGLCGANLYLICTSSRLRYRTVRLRSRISVRSMKRAHISHNTHLSTGRLVIGSRTDSMGSSYIPPHHHASPINDNVPLQYRSSFTRTLCRKK
eukprot:6792066-Prymnesium_polylepis.2